MKIKKCLVVYTIPRNSEQKSCLKHVEDILRKHSISYNHANRDFLVKEQLKGVDFVVAVGGDGTFLRAVQFMQKGLILGVNADPKNKEGFFMKSKKDDFEEKLRMILSGKFPIRNLPRLEAEINGKKIESLAINEFFIGPSRGYQASKYVIQVGSKKERHKSSGVLVTTPAGSHAWGYACGAKKMNLDFGGFQYVVREAFMGKVFKDYKMTKGLLKKNEKVIVFSEMLHGVLVADSVGREHHLRPNDQIMIKMSGKPIDAFWE